MENEAYRFDPNDINANKGIACISYIPLLFIIPILTNKNSPFVKFHVNQGIVLFIVQMVINFSAKIIANFLQFIPVIGWFGWIFQAAVGLFLVALSIFGIVTASQGQAKRFPIIGNVEIYR